MSLKTEDSQSQHQDRLKIIRNELTFGVKKKRKNIRSLKATCAESINPDIHVSLAMFPSDQNSSYDNFAQDLTTHRYKLLLATLVQNFIVDSEDDIDILGKHIKL